jgi:hypothetical protein
VKDCEHFFAGGHVAALSDYENYLSNPAPPRRKCASRSSFMGEWNALRNKLNEHLTVFYWDQLLDFLCDTGFRPREYFEQLSPITHHNNSLIEATRARWLAAGIDLTRWS